jgi:hypothetical protein
MADANELIIRMKLDRSLAEREAEQFHKAEKARIARTLSDAEVAEKARTAFIQRENAQRVQAAAKAQKTTVEQAREAVEAEKRLAGESADAAKKAAREAAEARKRAEREAKAEIDRLARESARAAKEAAREAAADAKQWDKRLLTDAEIAERAKTEVVRRANRQRVHEAADAAGREKGLVVDLKAVWDAKVGSILKAGPAVAGVAAGMAAMKVGVDVLQALDDKARAFADSTREATKALIAQHKAHLELSGFAGTPGVTGPELEKSARLAAASGLTIDEATEVRKAAEASAYSLVDREAVPAQDGMPAVDAQRGLVSRAAYDRGIAMAAKMAAYSGGSPTEYGKGVGTVINLEGRRVEDPGVIESRMLQYDKLANIGKFETASGLFDQVDRNLAFVKSGVVPGPQLAGLTALYAQSNQAEAATFTKQALTAVSGGLMQARGINIDEAFAEDAKTTSGYFQGIGIGQQDTPMARLFKVGRDVRARKAIAQARGMNFNPDEYLIQQGFGNVQLRQALLMFEGGMDQVAGDILPTLGKQFAPGTIDAVHSNYLQNTPGGQARSMEAGGDIAKAVVGTKFGPLNMAMEAEYNSQAAAGKRMFPLADYMAPPSLNPASEAYRWFMGAPQGQLLSPVASRLDRELGRLGISIPAVRNDGPLVNRAYSSPGSLLADEGVSLEDKARVFSEAQAAIQDAGGDPSLGLARAMDKMADELAAIRRSNEQVAANTRPAAAMPAGRPRQPPARP